MQVNQELDAQQHLATQAIRSHAKSIARTLSTHEREKLAAVGLRKFEAQRAYRQTVIECENAVERTFTDMFSKI